MAFTKCFLRMKRMHELIRRKATGTPDQFAEKMGMSRSSVLEHIKEMKELGSPVTYDKERQTYYYECNVSLQLGFRTMDDEEMAPIKGGNLSVFSTVQKYWTPDQYVCPSIFFIGCMYKILVKNRWLLIISILCIFKMIITHITNLEIFTDEVYRDTFTYIAGEQRLNEFLDKRSQNQVQSSLLLSLFLAIKLFALTIAILIGFAMFRVRVRFIEVFKSVLIAEFIMLIPSVIRLIWFSNFEQLVVLGDYQAFAPWGIHYYLLNYDVPIFLLNVSVFINLFEVLFLAVIIFRLKKCTNLSFVRTTKYTLIGYMPVLASAMILFSFLLKIL